MSEDIAIVAIAALLPLTAYMTVAQKNPYHALVIRGILGAVAALVYVAFGAADVALTEALVGTMLSITLYAVAVRSSLTMRLGVLEAEIPKPPNLREAIATSSETSEFARAIAAIRDALSPYHVRLEFVTYANPQTMQTALAGREIHGTCVAIASANAPHAYHLNTRVRRLHEIIQPELPAFVSLAHVDLAALYTAPQATHPHVPTSGDPA